jgi:putative intracellular protease/amidase
MVDLLHRDPFVDDSLNEDFAALVQFFHETGRTTGLICHAPAALAAAPRIDGRWIYDGYRMTCIKTVVDRMLEDMPLVRRFRGGSRNTPPSSWPPPARTSSRRSFPQARRSWWTAN